MSIKIPQPKVMDISLTGDVQGVPKVNIRKFKKVDQIKALKGIMKKK